MSYNAPSGEVFTGGATTSQHIDAEDDDHFENTTFKLKRTRSLGLLDEFIDPEKQEERIDAKNDAATAPTPAASSAPLHPSPDTKDESLQSESPQITSPTLAFLASPDLLPHDDTDLVAEPSRHVDYLSHQWDVSDISKSWRYVILRRKDVANAARLENASWRTWAQRRSNLKTISPEEVNWSKESDVTWLYGPIVDDDDNDMDHDTRHDDCKSGTASSIVAGDISIARKKHGPKPILKKRTVQDMMISHLNLLKLQVATARSELEQVRREDAEAQARKDKSTESEKPPDYFDYNLISAKLNSQYKNYSAQGSRNNSQVDLASKNPVSPADLAAKLLQVSDHATESQTTVDSTPEPLDAKEQRHIHFNDEVQQCIAVDDFSDDNADYDYDDEYDDDYDYGDDDESYLYETYAEGTRGNLEAESFDDEDDDDEDEDDEGGFFLKVRSPSSASVAGLVLPSLTSTTTKDAEQSDDSEPVSADSKVYKTIHLLPPTTLNYGSSDEDSDDCNPYTSSLSHNVDNSTSRGYDYYYDYNTVYQVDPNHAIYGSKKAPDVVDVPENITLGSNFDYEIIENDDILHFENAPLSSTMESIPPSTASYSEDRDKLPISSLENSATNPLVRPNPFSLDALDGSDSDSDSDDDGGLSINAKSSSQSLAQLVFGHSLTAARSSTPGEENYPALESRPTEGHITAINPRYSSTSLSKQPHSSSSLADQFLNTGMTKASGPNSLSDSFFNFKSPESRSPSSLSLTGTQSPPVQKKTTPLPPHTTSANAFLGTSTPPPPGQAPRKGFMLDSDSESEDEFIEDVMLPASVDKNAKGYASLYQVADRNGISVPTQSEEDSGQGQKHRVGLAMANFLGGWNKGN